MNNAYSCEVKAVCFRTGNSGKAAKHQLEAQIARRHVQSHTAGTAARQRQTDVQVCTVSKTRHKSTGAENSSATQKK